MVLPKDSTDINLLPADDSPNLVAEFSPSAQWPARSDILVSILTLGTCLC